MSMRDDTNNDRAGHRASPGQSIGHDNARAFSAQYGIIRTVEGTNAHRL